MTTLKSLFSSYPTCSSNILIYTHTHTWTLTHRIPPIYLPDQGGQKRNTLDLSREDWTGSRPPCEHRAFSDFQTQMGSPLCDKRYPVSYTKSLKAVGAERRKPVTMVEFAGPEFTYKPASAFPYPSDTSSHPSTRRNMAVQKTIPSSSDDTRNMMVPTQVTFKGQVVWPSPPLAPCDVDVHYCIQDSIIPSSGTASKYNYTPASPNGWCPSVPVVQEAPARYHGQDLSTSTAQDPSDTCTTSSSVDLGLDSSDGFLLALNCENGDPNNHMWGVDLLPSMETFETSPVSQTESVVESPASIDTPRDTPSSQNLESRSMPSSASPPSHSTESGETEKSDEPYAKLIYKAFMSRPDYSMTLQEIYQWFRVNTAKAVTETGGWQNSIRHNLSMNAVSRHHSLLCSYFQSNITVYWC